MATTQHTDGIDEELVTRFGKEYDAAQSTVFRDIERSVCGCDYGGTSWTKRSEADLVSELLELGPDKNLLEVGAGSGWPCLYLASETGCNAVLLDVPFEGIKIASERAVADGLADTCMFVVADGTVIPIGDGYFDAISHSDVLCCLDEKLSMLKDCRRVLKTRGKMVFTVISIVPNLSAADYALASNSGPPWIETQTPYPDMLSQAGWHIVEQTNLSNDFRNSVGHQLREEEAHADELRALYGEAEFSEKLARRRRTFETINAGLLQREMFSVI